MTDRFSWELSKSILKNATELWAKNTNEDLASLHVKQLRMIGILIRRIEEDMKPEVKLLTGEVIEGEAIEIDFCCFCEKIATGRLVFIGKKSKVVANPFCSDHIGEVYEQTHRSLLVIHSPRSVHADYTVLQRWEKGESMPKLPESEAELIMQGGRNKK